MAIRDPRSGYKKSTQSKTEGRVTHTEHWSGRVDAEVRPETLRLKIHRERRDE